MNLKLSHCTQCYGLSLHSLTSFAWCLDVWPLLLQVLAANLPRTDAWKTLQGSELRVKCGVGSQLVSPVPESLRGEPWPSQTVSTPPLGQRGVCTILRNWGCPIGGSSFELIWANWGIRRCAEVGVA